MFVLGELAVVTTRPGGYFRSRAGRVKKGGKREDVNLARGEECLPAHFILQILKYLEVAH